MVRSVEDLERMANPTEPPLKLKELENITEEFRGLHDREALDKRLVAMEKAFCQRGDPNAWPDDVLTKIDQCFINNFYVNDAPCDSLFYPSHPSNVTSFMTYRDDVDAVLRDNKSSVPQYARQYFAYAMLWEKRGHRFPMPLGTASVIEALHTLLKKYRRGLTEVSHISCLISCAHTAVHSCATCCTTVRRV